MAICGVSAGVVLRSVLFQYDPQHPFLPFFPAVVLAAAVGGAGPGIVAMTAGAAAASYWIEPVGSFWMSQAVDWLRLGAFVAMSLAAIWICVQYRRIESVAAEAHEQRSRADRQLFSILESITDGFAALDPQWRVTYINERAAQLARRSREEMLGRNIWEFFGDVVGTKTDRELRRAMDERLPVRFDAYYRTFDTWTEFHAYPTDAGIAIFVQDVTERKRSEQALRESEERLRLAMGAGRMGSWEADLASGEIFCTDQCRLNLGVSPNSRLTEKRLFDEIIHPEDREKTRDLADRAIAEGTQYDAEYRVVGEDGVVRWVMARGHVICDGGGTAKRMVGVTMEVTERRRAEEALRQSEQFYRSLGEAVPGFIWSCGPSGHCDYVNGRLLEYAGMTLEQFNADAVGTRSWHHPDERNTLSQVWEHVNRHGEPYQIEYRLRRHDGQYRWFLARGVPVKDASGKVTKWIGTATDIDERKRVEDALAKAKREADAANAAKDQFLAVLSHELRTPLTPVLATVSDMVNRCPLTDEVRSELAMVRRNVELEARLIDDLLDLTRIAKGKLKLQCRPVDAHALLEQAMGFCDSEVKAKNLTVVAHLNAKQTFVLGDDTRLRQVFWNVLKNAVKFTGEGGTVRVETYNEHGEDGTSGTLALRVTDTGIGIDPATLPRMFNAFEQGDPATTRRFGGLGLGLAITKALMDAHRGSIQVESDGLGKGATFTLRLQTVAAPRVVESDAPAAPTRPIEPAEPPRKRLSILLVEDHADTARVMSRLLRGCNFDVQTADCVQRGIQRAAENQFDLLISDIGLPDGTGLEVMRHLKEQYRLPGIALSGFGMEEDLRKSREAGFAEHLTKPIDIEQLLAAIERTTGYAPAAETEGAAV